MVNIVVFYAKEVFEDINCIADNLFANIGDVQWDYLGSGVTLHK